MADYETCRWRDDSDAILADCSFDDGDTSIVVQHRIPSDTNESGRNYWSRGSWKKAALESFLLIDPFAPVVVLPPSSMSRFSKSRMTNVKWYQKYWLSQDGSHEIVDVIVLIYTGFYEDWPLPTWGTSTFIQRNYQSRLHTFFHCASEHLMMIKTQIRRST